MPQSLKSVNVITLFVEDELRSKAFYEQIFDVVGAMTGSANLETAETVKELQDALVSSYTPQEMADLRAMVHSDHIYSRLVQSLAPMVYGHEVVKKGITGYPTGSYSLSYDITGIK